MLDKDAPVRDRSSKSTASSSNKDVGVHSYKKLLTDKTDEYLAATKGVRLNQDKDPYAKFYGGGGQQGNNFVLKRPPYDLDKLLLYPNENSTLRQCIDAMVVNTVGFGYRLEYVGEEGQEEDEAVCAEKSRLEELLEQPNAEYTLTELLSRKQFDKEILGNSYLEVVRNNDNTISSFYNIPGQLIRVTNTDDEPVNVNTYYTRDGKTITKQIPKYFKRYVQWVKGKMIYFKEFGDPRIIDPKTGKENTALSLDESATELIPDCIFYPGQDYGIPRWINQLCSVMGTREAEMVNMRFFKENAIPAMVAMVAGGNLTPKSLSDLKSHFLNGSGAQSQNRILILEAQSQDSSTMAGNVIGDVKQTAPKLELKPLGSDRQSDELFQEYIKNGNEKIRSAFRLPKMYVGYTDDMNRSTADQAVATAERQVFIPERNKIDDMFNLKLLTDADGKPPMYWRYRSNPPRMASSEEILQGLQVFGDLGAISPNTAIGIANELYDLQIPSIDEDWGNMPSKTLNPMVVQGINPQTGEQNPKKPNKDKKPAPAKDTDSDSD